MGRSSLVRRTFRGSSQPRRLPRSRLRLRPRRTGKTTAFIKKSGRKGRLQWFCASRQKVRWRVI
jgi:hypothetical protein